MSLITIILRQTIEVCFTPRQNLPAASGTVLSNQSPLSSSDWGSLRNSAVRSPERTDPSDVLELLGHKVIERLAAKRKLAEILDDLRMVVFTRQEDATRLVRDAFIETEIWEEIYDRKRTPLT